MTQYTYIQSEPQLWTVGFFRPSGEWEPESDHADREAAAQRAAWLNGSGTSIISADARYLLRLAVDSWPQFDDREEDVNGADLVEWFAEYRKKCQRFLDSAEGRG